MTSTTLKQSRDQGDLEVFIKVHENDPKGDIEAIDKMIKASTQESASKAQKASSQDASDD